MPKQPRVSTLLSPLSSTSSMQIERQDLNHFRFYAASKAEWVFIDKQVSQYGEKWKQDVSRSLYLVRRLIDLSRYIVLNLDASFLIRRQRKFGGQKMGQTYA